MEVDIDNLPYTIVGGTATPKPMQSILLTAKGIKEIAERLNDDDMVRITSWEDVSNECEDIKHYSKITRITPEDKKSSSSQNPDVPLAKGVPSTKSQIKKELDEDYENVA